MKSFFLVSYLGKSSPIGELVTVMVDFVIQNFLIMGKFISHANMQREGIANRSIEIRKIMYTVYGHK